MIEQIIVLLQKGMEEKVTFAKESIEGTLEPVSYTHLTLPTIYSV